MILPRRLSISLATIPVLLVVCACNARVSASSVTDPPAPSLTLDSSKVDAYPATARGDVVDDYHGTRVADPYRWLEDPDAPATRAWIEAQNELSSAYLDRIPARDEIRSRLHELWDYARWTAPSKRGGMLFFSKNDGLQNQPVVYVQDGRDGAPRVLFDPNALRADGTVAVTDLRPTESGKLVAYQLSEAGSDWNTLRVRDVQSGKDLGDRLEWIKFSSVAWAPDEKSFYYATYPEHDASGKQALRHHTLYRHVLGEPQSKDRVVYSAPDQPTYGFGARITDDGELLIVTQTDGTEPKSRQYVRRVADGDGPFATLFGAFDADYDFLGKRGERLWYRTDNSAPKARIISLDWRDPDPAKWTTVVPESADAIESAAMAGGRLVVTYLRDARNVVRVFELDGKPAGEIALPSLGSVAQLSADETDPELFFSFTSFTTPGEIWRADARTLAAEVWQKPKISFDPSSYVTEQVWFESRDKTRVPMFVTRRRDVTPSPDTRCMLYGYGGFDISVKPSFSASVLCWIERGGLWASANLRGGGELGREWHEAGTKERKQNVFDDFVAAAEHLIAKRWTSSKRLGIYGRSNGGLLVGACMTQRPDLFGCALPAVGVLDMLRFQKFTIGRAWTSDYGCAENAGEFPYLVRYSPLHNLKPGVAYPPTLVTTGDHDDRVVPAHSFKFAAELQRVQTGPNPALIRIETRGGHGAGKPTSMQIDEVADMWAFAEHALGR